MCVSSHNTNRRRPCCSFFKMFPPPCTFPLKRNKKGARDGWMDFPPSLHRSTKGDAVADESRPRDPTTDEPIRHNPFPSISLFSLLWSPPLCRSREIERWMCGPMPVLIVTSTCLFLFLLLLPIWFFHYFLFFFLRCVCSFMGWNRVL